MICAKIFRNTDNIIYGFEVENHGNKIVCSAVSVLTFNAVNSIEAFATDIFTCDMDENGGYLKFTLTNTQSEKISKNAELLLNSMALGLRSIESEYGKEIKIIDKVVA